MKPDPTNYDLVLRYLEDSSTDEESREERELLLKSPEARAILMELTGQMIFMIDRQNAFAELPDQRPEMLICPLDGTDEDLDDDNLNAGPSFWAMLWQIPKRLTALAASLLILATLAFSTVRFLQKSGGTAQQSPFLLVSDHMGDVTVSRGGQNFKSPFRELHRISAGDIIETNNWLSWAELRLDSGTSLTVLVNSKIWIKSFTKDRMEVEIFGGGVHIKSAKNDPTRFLIHSDRLHVATAESDMLILNWMMVRAVAGCYTGSAEVSSGDETQKVVVEPGWMASIQYDDTFRVSRHPDPTYAWSTRDMTPAELGTGLWQKADQPGQVKLLAAPKTYNYPNGETLQIDEILAAVWRSSVKCMVKPGSRLVITGRYAKPGPVSFALRTHSEYGKLLDIFVKTLASENLAAAGETWRVDIPVDEMQPTFKPGNRPDGSLVFNLSAHTSEKIGLEVYSIDLIPPE